MMIAPIKATLMPVGTLSQRASRVALVAFAAVTAPASGYAATEVTWPEPRLPDELTTFAIGQAMTVDGLPMRLQGFVARQRPASLIEAVRRSLGQPLVESNHGNKRILGRAEGRFYVTVQIEASEGGSKGIVATTDLGQLAKNHQAIQRAKAQWLDRLPAGSIIASDLRSDDGGKEARHTVILNDQGPAHNRDAIVTLLSGEGYVLEREVLPPAGPGGPTRSAASQPSQSPYLANGATSLYFRAPGKEAMAVIARSGSRTAIVLNTVSTLKADR